MTDPNIPKHCRWCANRLDPDRARLVAQGPWEGTYLCSECYSRAKVTDPLPFDLGDDQEDLS